MLAIGDNCLPACGIGAISEQMLKSIGEESVVCGCKITSLEKDSDGSVTVASADGNTIQAKYGCVLGGGGACFRVQDKGTLLLLCNAGVS